MTGRFAIKHERKQRILVVEDEPDLRQFTARALIHSGYQVEVAIDGAAAWEALQLSTYDLLITDNNMPNLSGVQLLGKIHDARMTLPVIMTTGIIPTKELTIHAWLQSAKFLLKPYALEKLLGLVKEVLHETAGLRGQGSPPPTG